MDTNRGRAGAIFGALLILLGIIFLIGQFISIDFGHYLWPFFVIGFGALFFIGMVASGQSGGALAIPGSIFVMVGLILLVQNTFNVFESWAYAWTLIIVAVGIGIAIQGFWSNRRDLPSQGWRLIRLGLLLFLIFGAFFELFIFHQNSILGRIFWPVALILVGIVLIFSRLLRPSRNPPNPPDSSDDHPNPPQTF